MLVAGLAFLVGAAMTSCAGLLNNHRGSDISNSSPLGSAALVTLVLGRVSLGVGVGFANQAVPLFLNEMSPAHLRGAFNIMFQLATTIGIILAQLVNVCESSFLYEKKAKKTKRKRKSAHFFFLTYSGLEKKKLSDDFSGWNVAPRHGRLARVEDLSRARSR